SQQSCAPRNRAREFGAGDGASRRPSAPRDQSKSELACRSPLLLGGLIVEELHDLRHELMQCRVLATIVFILAEQLREILDPCETALFLLSYFLRAGGVTLDRDAVSHHAGANERLAQHR